MITKAVRPCTLQHIHVSSPTTYHQTSKIQERLVRQFLDHKASPSTTTAPRPTVITFSPQPIYTTGRRELRTPVSVSQHAQLTSPLANATEDGRPLIAEVYKATRGGQITYHGPGQLVIYPVMDLLTVALSPRCYVSLLEGVTISTLQRYGINGVRTSDPGVWLQRDTNTKIAALGVHLRRNVSSHGVGLNVSTDMRWFDRIVACGLEGKGVGSMVRELRNLHEKDDLDRLEGAQGVEEVGKVWVHELATQLGMQIESVVKHTDEEVSCL